MRLTSCSPFALILLLAPTAAAQGFDLDAEASTDGADATGDVDGGDDDDDADDDVDDDDDDGDGGGDGGLFDTELPYRYTERPLTLPEMHLTPRLSFDVLNLDFGAGSATIMTIAAGAEFGITDDFMVEAIPVSVIFGDPDFDYGYFMAGATYRFYEDIVDIGGRFRFLIDSSANLMFNPGLPVRYRSDIFRVDTGLELAVTVPDGGDAAFGFVGVGDNFFTPRPGVPIEAAVQIIDPLWAGLDTGFGVADVGEFGDTFFMPIGLNVGGTVPMDEEPFLDVKANFSFPVFLRGSGDNPITDLWHLGVVAKANMNLDGG